MAVFGGDRYQRLAELAHDYRIRTEAVERATLDGVDGFNQAQRLAFIGYSPHSEAGANYCRRLASQVAQRA